MNPWDGLYRSKCSMALTVKVAMKIEGSIGEAKVSPEYITILETLKNDLGFPVLCIVKIK